jgi:SAM-dependent methyltransferase
MSVAYRLLYAIGFTPWEHIAGLPDVTKQISALFDREESGREPPYGQALDLGCGSGIWSVELARRGWQVTSVDLVPKALRRACKRARQAGVDLRLVQGDVTALGPPGSAPAFPSCSTSACSTTSSPTSSARRWVARSARPPRPAPRF